MTSKNYGWQKKWTVDFTNGLFTHNSGLVVQVKRSRVSGTTDFIVKNIAEWSEKLKETMTLHDAAGRAKRLLREAITLYEKVSKMQK